MISRLIITALYLCFASAGWAQNPESRESFGRIVPGSHEENYLRYLQSIGRVPLYPLVSRGMGPAESRRIAPTVGTHPWSGRMGLQPIAERRLLRLLPVEAIVRLNSNFPYGDNDQAVWAGRGVTASAEGGFIAEAGPLAITVNPIAFVAQNGSFPTAMFVETHSPYADPQYASVVDRPQRFGDGSYSRVDPGQSSVQVSLLGLTGGISTANMGWGPMHNYPYILSANGPGFPHVFAGTAAPLSIGIGRIHTRILWGRLDQSEYSPVTGSETYASPLEPGTRRFATGLVLAFEPRPFTGLTIGAGRFYHSIWPREGPPAGYFRKPFESVLKIGATRTPGFFDPRGGTDNQLLSAFARWVLPRSGFETYAEYGREDHNYNYRDLVQQPDHSRSYGLGVRKVMRADSTQLSALRAELINYQLPAIARLSRGEGGTYLHYILRQGHTNRGQVLGADAGLNSGGASTVAWDRFDRGGRLTVGWTRNIRRETGNFHITGQISEKSRDVWHTLNVERGQRIGRLESVAGATLVREFNRNFAEDAWNLNVTLGGKFLLGR